ncbi:MAG: hypothetical protein HKO57_09290, partial [Akkermansiaceae bacterium]|nr:hypothetical protein [Akkermansiaceae bacterium]
LGVLDKEIANLFGEIGRYLSANVDKAPCRKALRGRRGLVGQINALRTSIVLNNRLAGREIPQTVE